MSRLPFHLAGWSLALCCLFASHPVLAQEDGGVSELVPPTLVADSPALHPAGLEDTTGTVTLELLVDEQGAVAEVAVTASEHPRFTEAAVEAARGLRFAPATLEGRPQPVRMPFVYLFQGRAGAPRVAKVYGSVRARGTRRPLADAAILVSGQAAPVHPDEEGHFLLQLPEGTHTLEVRAPGYRPATFEETLTAGQQLEVIYRLEPLQLKPYETVVRDERPRTEVTRISLHEQELREVPGTQGDPFRVVMLMPGVGSLASGLGYPVVRGGQPAATGFFIDGVRVPMLYHLLLGPAVVQPEFIDTLDFFPGTPPVQYGRLLGGAVEGRVSRPREDRLHATASLDFINSGVFLEAPIHATGTHVSVAGRMSYTGLLASLVTDALSSAGSSSIEAEFWDYQARVEQPVGRGRLRLLALGSSDVLAERAPEEPGQLPDGTPLGASNGAGIVTRFHRVDLRGTHPLAGGELELGVTAGVDTLSLTSERGPPRVVLGEYTLREQSLAGRFRWTRALGQTLQLTAGGDVEHRRATVVATGTGAPAGSRYFSDDDPLTRPTSNARLSGAYAELRWQPTPRWMVVPGLRADAYQLLQEVTHTTLEPRLTVRHALTQSLVLKGGAGLFHQAPTVLLHLPVMDASGLRYGLQEGMQLDVGAEWKPHEQWELSADVFYNPLHRTVELDLRQVLENRRRGGLGADDPAASGEAYGFELMARHPLGNDWFGWASYSFLQSRRRLPVHRYDDRNQHVGIEVTRVPFAFEQEHVFNAAISRKLGRGYTVGAVLHFNTGRPETGELTPQPMRPGEDSAGNPRWVRQDRDAASRMPAFWRVDLRASKAWALDDLMLELSLDLLNASLQQEVLFYEYTSERSAADTSATLRRKEQGFPVVLPMLGLKGTY
ncbi:TonB-dependent receptor domain-containing protein [Pyxidicoccus xibeiensis]|uniref:TonB-dependent receptor domain-containing protein n=1 Tax=Pyxidicoccus xibeiensis TaxID=2906759 RepID=UPI0020A781EE|nr:TonB-dependent receptor [Pyxidicoccus xibeiensis]MCP3143237.1 TonB-dependent receptor [Pyxidicoccus xibeiensis]